MCPLRMKYLFPPVLWGSQSEATQAFKTRFPKIKTNFLGACLPGAGPPGWGASCAAQNCHSCEIISALKYSPVCGHLPQGGGGSGGGLVTKPCLTLESPWTVALQTPLSIGFSRQEYWGGLPFPPLQDLLNLRTELVFPALQMVSYVAGRCFTTEPQGKPPG